MAIVDAHHHLWDLNHLPYPWLRPEAPPRPFGDHTQIKRDYLPDDYRRDTAGLSIAASVHVEAAPGADDPTAETRWLETTASQSGIPTVSVAHADLGAADIADRLDALLNYPLLRGVRAGLAWRANSPWHFAGGPGLAKEPSFRAGVAQLARRNLSLDLILLPEQLPEVAVLARDFPETNFVLDHLATLELGPMGSLETWRAGITEVARLPNVSIKLSGLWTVARRWQIAALRDPIRHAVGSFGPTRCMWGSNLPIETLMCDAAAQVAVLRAILDDHSAADLAAVFGDTARRVYRIGRDA